jgi:hypothetical protein
MKNSNSNITYYLVVITLAVLSVAIPSFLFYIQDNDKGKKTPDGFFYKIADDGNGVTITGYEGEAKTIDIPEQSQGLPVTSIGYMAFDYCTNLKSITIPSSVTSIGNRAFNECYDLTSIVIPSSVTSIGREVFSKCRSLTSVTIPSSVTSIGNMAFSGCGSLASIEIPSSVTKIGNEAFAHCKSLTNIDIPSSVTSIEKNAFYGCSSLTGITVDSQNPAYASIDGVLFDKTIQTIVAYPNWKEEKSYTIPSSVTSIEDDAFSYSYRLTNLTIPSSVTKIGFSAFSSCRSLTSITVADLNPAYASIDGILFDKSIKTIITYLAGKDARTYTIPSSVTKIGNEAFAHCKSLTNIDIPSSVTSIGNEAFFWCISLTSITIPPSVTSIGRWVFYGCEGLTDVTLSRHTQVERFSIPESKIIYRD